jgi:ABC-type dipeptide/oligopeptide/nickel transport system ATPase component
VSAVSTSDDERPTLAVEELSVSYTGGRDHYAVREVSFTVAAGEILGIVGESGSGKSSIAHAVMGLLPATAAVTGRIRLGALDVVCLREAELCRIRGSKVGMIFQDPLAALNPVFPISTQIIDTIRTHHKGTSRSDARAIAADAISEMGVPRDRLDSYPHQLSGGMRQRVLIASAMVARPHFLIADEPTSDLDTVSQAQILRILRRLRAEHRVGVLLISHDMRVIRAVCDRVAVMHGGAVIEHGLTQQVLSSPIAPYTKELMRVSTRARSHSGRFVTMPVEYDNWSA